MGTLLWLFLGGGREYIQIQDNYEPITWPVRWKMDKVFPIGGFREEEEEEEEHFQVGGRFSKNSSERETILRNRKQSLLAHARS